MLEVPRSVVLAAWASAVTAGSAPVPEAVRAVTGSDEPHRLDGEVGGGLADLLVSLRDAPGAVARVALPAPGDPAGMAGPAALTAGAVDAGEAVLVLGPAEPIGRLGLVPEVTAFGSAWEPGAMVTWRVHRANLPGRPESTTLADAQRALRGALAQATRALADLDVARWREDAADRIVGVRDGALPTTAFPPGTPADVLAVATSAARVRAIVALATEDDGASVTGWEADARTRSLREVDAVARHALAVAANSGPGPGPGRGAQRASATR